MSYLPDLTPRIYDVSRRPQCMSPNGDIFKATLRPDSTGATTAANDISVAIKRLRLGVISAADKERYEKNRHRELDALRTIDCPHVNCILGTYVMKAEVCIVTLWMEGGNLKNYITKYPATSAAVRRKLLIGAARAVRYLHNLPVKILHGDIHPANVLIGPASDAVLVDFGLSKLANLDGEFSLTAGFGDRGGAHGYIAPELSDSEARRSEASDVFAFGCLMYATFMTGQSPFTAYGAGGQLGGRRLCDLDPRKRVGIPDDLLSIIDRCVRIDAAERPSMTEVVTALEQGCNAESPNERNGTKDLAKDVAPLFQTQTTSAAVHHAQRRLGWLSHWLQWPFWGGRS